MAATITACTSASSVNRAVLVQKAPIVRASSPVLGRLAVAAKVGKVRCSMEGKAGVQESGSLKVGVGASLVAGAMSSPAATALVDERMSTEGTGLPFGLSNNILGWILFGIFGLIWALYIIYTSDLEEDEESGLSL